MKLNQNVRINRKRDHVALVWFVSIVEGSLWWWFLPSGSSGVCRGDEDSEDESLSHGGRQNNDNLYRVHMPSLYSCGSSYGSETSIPAAAHTVSNAPVTEYM